MPGAADRPRIEASEAGAASAPAEAEERARRLLLDARETADGVRAEGMEIVSDLRQMGDALRANAERLLGDIQAIHSRMLSRLERVETGMGEKDVLGDPPAEAAGGHPAEGTGAGGDQPAEAAGDDGELEIPDFIAP